jgi:hypothetical protein
LVTVTLDETGDHRGFIHMSDGEDTDSVPDIIQHERVFSIQFPYGPDAGVGAGRGAGRPAGRHQSRHMKRWRRTRRAADLHDAEKVNRQRTADEKLWQAGGDDLVAAVTCGDETRGHQLVAAGAAVAKRLVDADTCTVTLNGVAVGLTCTAGGLSTTAAYQLDDRLVIEHPTQLGTFIDPDGHGGISAVRSGRSLAGVLDGYGVAGSTPQRHQGGGLHITALGVDVTSEQGDIGQLTVWATTPTGDTTVVLSVETREGNHSVSLAGSGPLALDA